MQRLLSVKISQKLASDTTLLDLVSIELFENGPGQDRKLNLHQSFDETPYHVLDLRVRRDSYDIQSVDVVVWQIAVWMEL